MATCSPWRVLAGCYSAEEPINIACGTDTSIAVLASEVAAVIGYAGGFR
jgi:hypothetical protein